ncbi:MAG: peptide deformylase [Candidatus Dojkabacteria bacterium]
MSLKILQIGDDRLTQVSREVEKPQDKKIQRLIAEMCDLCEKDRDGTAGLAAPQVGENIRLTVIRRIDKTDKIRRSDRDRLSREESMKYWDVLINPEIIEKSEEESVIWEACLSIGKGDKQIWGPVSRPDYVRIKYETEQEESKELEAKGFFAHLLQHEIDHLDGILFTSHVPNVAANLWTAAELDEYIEANGSYPPVK